MAINIHLKRPSRDEVVHLVIDFTELRDLSEKSKRTLKYCGTTQKLHLAVDIDEREIICNDLTLSNIEA